MADKKYIGEPGKQDDPCWKGYEMVGMKKKGGRKVPNCVPEATDIIAKAKAAVAKKAGAKLKLDPDTGTPDHFTAAMRRKKGLSEQSSDTFPWHEDPKNPTRMSGERKDQYGNKVKNVAKYLAKKAMKANEETEGKVYSVHVKGDSAQHNSPEFKKHLAGWGGEKHYTSDKGAAYKFKKEYQANGFHHGVGSMFKKLDSEHDGHVNEEVEQVDEYNNYRKAGNDPYAQRKQYIAMDRAEKKGVMPGSATSTADAIAAFKAKGGKTTKLDTMGNMKEGHMPTADEPTDANKKTADKVRAMMAKEKKPVREAAAPYQPSAAYQAARDANPYAKQAQAAKRERDARSDAIAQKQRKKAEELRSGYKNVKEELGKENEWGTDALRQKYAAMTPGQEGLAADKIPTFDPRYDDVTTQYCGGLKEALLSEISAKGAVARADFRAKVQKVLADPAAIAKAKKTLAKKKAAEKAAEPVHLVMQLRKASSIGSKVQFRNGESHHVAPNHVEKFNDKYHSLKSSIEKESLINRAHKSHADFFKAIAEETLDVTQQGGGPQYDSHRGNGGHIGDIDLCCDDIRFQDFDEKDMEELEAEVDNMTWEDIVDEYDDEELEYVDGDEEIEEGVTPQGRLKKKFSAMRNKTRRNMARNLALKRVSTPDRIKARSISTARRMVYQRFLRGRDKSSMSASEKSRIEAQVKRLAPSVARLSVRIVGQVRKLEQSRIKNRTRGKKR